MPESQIARLPNRFVSQRAAAAHHADLAGVVNVAGHDADLAFAGRDHAGAIRTDQDGIAGFNFFVDANHVEDRHAFGDRGDDLDAGVDRFQNRVGGERRRNEDHRRVGAGLLDGFFDRVKNRHALDVLATFAGRHAADHVRAVVAATQRVKRAGVARDALADDFRVAVNKDAHD